MPRYSTIMPVHSPFPVRDIKPRIYSFGTLSNEDEGSLSRCTEQESKDLEPTSSNGKYELAFALTLTSTAFCKSLNRQKVYSFL